jgi:SpoIID/LytB domain protein
MRSLRPLTILFALCLSLSMSLPAAAEPPSPDEHVVECEEVFVEGCPSHASGSRPEFGPHLLGNPTDVVEVLRVGLRSTTFNPTTGAVVTEQASLDHTDVRVTSSSNDFHVIDLSSGKQIVAPSAGQIVRTAASGAAYEVSVDGTALGTFAGPIRFRAAPGDTFRVTSIRRSVWVAPAYVARVLDVPDYYGEIEVSRGASTVAGMVNLVNIVPLEPYVRGVVVNEGIATFHPDALKAQAVAARGYALANRNSTRFGRPFGIDDSTSSQVYRGRGSEHPNGNLATDATTSLVATYAGMIIQALYSSSMGGHTEDNEWIFNIPASQLPGTNAEPYLRGIYDGEGAAPDLSTEAGIAAFWSAQQPQTFDSCPRVNNRFARWQLQIPAATIKSRVTGANANRVVMLSGNTSGALTNVEITRRMAASQRAAIVTLTFTSGVGEVRGWDNVRRVVGTSAASQVQNCTTNPPSTLAANFVLNNPNVIEPQFSGTTFTGILAIGGGWGHNVGMSQFGAHGRGLAGQTFIQILKGYYTGVDIAAYPIDIALSPGAGPRQLKQTFSSPNGTGVLRIIPSGNLQGIVVHIGDACDLRFTAEQLTSAFDTNISSCLVAGTNTIQYNPIGKSGSARVLVIVE